uniref:Uncharacterized protein n=1 Tax=Rousettus aegyptiacus TaxID=9407 RepID=A0A7J8HSC5_ROUAE|nr:hypothetical protein HJG63_010942 [Rousettus aegyptiacus]
MHNKIPFKLTDLYILMLFGKEQYLVFSCRILYVCVCVCVCVYNIYIFYIYIYICIFIYLFQSAEPVLESGLRILLSFQMFYLFSVETSSSIGLMVLDLIMSNLHIFLFSSPSLSRKETTRSDALIFPSAGKFRYIMEGNTCDLIYISTYRMLPATPSPHTFDDT